MNSKKRGFMKWKRSISAVMSSAVLIAALPVSASSVSASEAENTLIKAGSIPASEDTKTVGQPFLPGTAGSYSFRIPCLISLERNEEHRGSLVAAADARYETTGDGGGLDTIASVSSDMGKTWNYSFPIWFPDSEGYASNNATTVIDPVLVEGPDGTIYCMADVNPTGITTHYGNAKDGTGYIEVEGEPRIALAATYEKANANPAGQPDNYDYYVGDFENGYAPVRKRSDQTATDWRVDEWYNIEKKNESGVFEPLTQKQVNTDVDIQQNVFYKASELHIFNTGFVWVVESKDGGMSWENPRIINDQIKNTGDGAILVCPGKGLATSDNVITIPFYKTEGGEQASLIYSTDNGASWTRTNHVTHTSGAGKSSESELVELSDGTLRLISRTGSNKICYTDVIKGDDGSYSMGNMVQTDVSCWSNCKVTAIRYSRQVNGKDLILVACPSGPNNRDNGKIYAFLVNDDERHTMTFLSDFAIKEPYNESNTSFAYSCITEQKDGTIGLLWEPEKGGYIGDAPFRILYSSYQLKIEGDTVTFSKTNDTDTVFVEQGGTYAIPADSAAVTAGERDVVRIDPEERYCLFDHVASVNNFGFSTVRNDSAWIDHAQMKFIRMDNGSWRIKNERINHYVANTSPSFYLDPIPADMTVTSASKNGGTVFRFQNASNNSHMFFDGTKGLFDRMGSYDENNSNGTYEFTLWEKKASAAADDVIPGYERVSELQSGADYLMTCIWDNNIYVLYPYARDVAAWEVNAGTQTTGSKTGRSRLFKRDSEPIKRQVITGLTPGETVTVTADEMEYTVQVVEPVSKQAVGIIFSAALKEAEAVIAEKESYSAAGWENFETAYKEAENAQNPSVSDMRNFMQNLNNAKENVKLLDEEEEAGKAQTSLSQAKKEFEEGSAGYTAGWDAFSKAYQALQTAVSDESTTLRELEALYQALDAAKAKLVVKQAAGSGENTEAEIRENVRYTSGDYIYIVTSLTNRTAAIAGVSNTSLGKVNVNGTVTLFGNVYHVTEAAEGAFQKNQKITSVTLPADIEKIGKNAFAGCKKLKTVTVSGKELKEIGAKAFSGCKALKTINFKKAAKLKKIGKNAFKGIHKNARIKVPAKKIKAYQKKFAGKGQGKNVKITK